MSSMVPPAASTAALTFSPTCRFIASPLGGGLIRCSLVGRRRVPRRRWRSREAAEQSAVAAYGVLDAEGAEGVPERRRLAGDDGFAEVVLEALDDADGGQACAADEE